MIRYISLPTWDKIDEKSGNGMALNAVEKFVYDFEPDEVEESQLFRQRLKDALNYVTLEAKRDMTDFIKRCIL